MALVDLIFFLFRQNSKALRAPTHTTTPQSGNLKTLVINDDVFLLMADDGNCLEVHKLDITSPDPCLQSVCFLELPSLRPGISVMLYWDSEEWVPTAKNYARSRSSRASDAHFYSSTVSTIALLLCYRLTPQIRRVRTYALIIDVEALLSTIRTGVRHVRWADWGPFSTHLFRTTLLCTAGPSWNTRHSPLLLRQYYPRRTRYTQSMLVDASPSSRAGPQVFSSTQVSDRIWDQCRIETNMPYRDVVLNDINSDQFRNILADREWIVGIAMTSVRGLCVHTLTVSMRG